MSVTRYVYPTPQLAAEHGGDHILGLLKEASSTRRPVSLAISGGSSPRPMFEHLAKARFDWSPVHIFWVDERGVPPSDGQSNYRMAEETFLRPAGIPSSNVHRIQAELDPHDAAIEYSDELRDFFHAAAGEMPQFDVIHRGLGPDAHTASLFPGGPLIEDREHLVAAVYVEKMQQWRITMLPGVLLAARHTVMLAPGSDKAEAVRAIFEGPIDHQKYPAQAVAAADTAWFLDVAAASLIEGATSTA